MTAGSLAGRLWRAVRRRLARAGGRRIADAMDDRYRAGEAYRYDLAWDRLRWQDIHQTATALATADGARTPGLTLDIGCGTRGIIDHWPAGSPVVGLELSAVAAERYRQQHGGAECIVSAIEDFADPAGRRFDTIVGIETIEHWSDAAKGLQAVRRHLAPGGRLVLTTPNDDSLHKRVARKLGLAPPFCSSDHTHEFGFAELRRILTTAGFAVEDSRGVAMMPWWAMESEFGHRIRALTDNDEELLGWLRDLGHGAPHLAFIQCHRCHLAEEAA